MKSSTVEFTGRIRPPISPTWAETLDSAMDVIRKQLENRYVSLYFHDGDAPALWAHAVWVPPLYIEDPFKKRTVFQVFRSWFQRKYGGGIRR